jgi:hypothetical protein
MKFDKRPEAAPFEEPVIVTLTEEARGSTASGRSRTAARSAAGFVAGRSDRIVTG